MAGKKQRADEKRRLFEQEALPHLDAVYTMAVRLVRNPEEANDLLQETMLRAYRFFHQFTPGTNCRAWLLAILFNSLRTGYRRTSREQPASSADEFEHRLEAESLRGDLDQNNPEALVATARMDPAIEAALRSLPEEFRSAVLLVDLEELNYQEVSEVLAVPIGTVKSRVSRARAMLRGALVKFARERGIIRS
ncbi:MAG TPA: sigma-70 family RNA polymerase sigma factor [Candidatus Binataceae bacterium]|nr:sigma-70 family RNA polymerase sigma factor [Candidatus Binataceae bacterium]